MNGILIGLLSISALAPMKTPKNEFVFSNRSEVESIDPQFETGVPDNDDDDVLLGLGVRWFSDAGWAASLEYNTVLSREDFESDAIYFLIRGDF